MVSAPLKQLMDVTLKFAYPSLSLQITLLDILNANLAAINLIQAYLPKL